MIGLIILATSTVFVPLHVAHPVLMLTFLVLTALTFSLFGFMLGIWATSWEKLQFVPALIITPLTFLGGTFYALNQLPPIWQKITVARNPPAACRYSGASLASGAAHCQPPAPSNAKNTRKASSASIGPTRA